MLYSKKSGLRRESTGCRLGKLCVYRQISCCDKLVAALEPQRLPAHQTRNPCCKLPNLRKHVRTAGRAQFCDTEGDDKRKTPLPPPSVYPLASHYVRAAAVKATRDIARGHHCVSSPRHPFQARDLSSTHKQAHMGVVPCVADTTTWFALGCVLPASRHGFQRSVA